MTALTHNLAITPHAIPCAPKSVQRAKARKHPRERRLQLKMYSARL